MLFDFFNTSFEVGSFILISAIEVLVHLIEFPVQILNTVVIILARIASDLLFYLIHIFVEGRSCTVDKRVLMIRIKRIVQKSLMKVIIHFLFQYILQLFFCFRFSFDDEIFDEFNVFCLLEFLLKRMKIPIKEIFIKWSSFEVIETIL